MTRISTILPITLVFATLAMNGAVAACLPAGSTGLTTQVILTSNQQLTGTTINATGCDVGIYIGPGTDKVLISGVTVTGANEHGIFAQDASRVTIQYSVVTGNGVDGHACPPAGAAPPTCIAEDKGIELVGTSDSAITHNLVSFNRADGGIGVADDGPTNPGAPGTFPGISHGAKNDIVSENLVAEREIHCISLWKHAYLDMRTGRPKKALEIAEADREKLRMMALRPKSAQAMAMRARIVLHCEQGMSNSAVARKLQITGATVGKWRERYRQSGLDGLLDEPRVGAPRKITDGQIEEVVTKTLESMPPTARTGALA